MYTTEIQHWKKKQGANPWPTNIHVDNFLALTIFFRVLKVLQIWMSTLWKMGSKSLPNLLSSREIDHGPLAPNRSPNITA